jgi:hypothetical protein
MEPWVVRGGVFTVNRQGWLRLWIVLTVIGVPAAAIWDSNRKAEFWESQNRAAIKNCVAIELASPKRPDALECARRQGAYESDFEREGTTPAAYWSLTLASYFVLDLLLTGLIAGLVFVGRWVWRGFNPGAPL